MNAPRALAGARDSSELAPVDARIFVTLDGHRLTAADWDDRMLSLALRARADWAARDLTSPELSPERLRKLALYVVIRRVEKEARAAHSIERELHAILSSPERHTVERLQRVRGAWQGQLGDLRAWVSILASAVATVRGNSWFEFLEGEDPDAWLRRVAGEPRFLGEGI